MIDRTPITPLDPIAHRAAVARSGGQGRRPVFRRTDTSCDDARPENVGRRRSLALDQSEHDGRLMGNRDGGLCAAVPASTTLLIAGTMIVMLPCVAIADPLANKTQTTRTATVVASPDPLADHIAEAARRFAIPERWIRAVMRVESAGDMHARSHAGAMGLMQIMPETWAELRERYGLESDAYSARDNITAGAAYMREMLDRYGNIGAMLAAYNAGPRRYDAYISGGRPLPAETRSYVAMLAPLLGADEQDGGTFNVRLRADNWRDAPLFVVQSGDPFSAVSMHSDGHNNEDLAQTLRHVHEPATLQTTGLFAPVSGIGGL
ncbi:lytic transglycosylase domain-containing protein [Rhizobium pusense]|uniref:lytic transglycosylase domain-containing protein n=1 Tax=Agrobacterium pusense TaxID=648995 RepID=UPI00244C6F47|nr:lytic transglycosylase domain-containing protein [Agrobacterium pusense]MDH1270514.1 lytic transglycosylase domain-containing protein [Agrobacterium pusense]